MDEPPVTSIEAYLLVLLQIVTATKLVLLSICQCKTLLADLCSAGRLALALQQYHTELQSLKSFLRGKPSGHNIVTDTAHHTDPQAL